VGRAGRPSLWSEPVIRADQLCDVGRAGDAVGADEPGDGLTDARRRTVHDHDVDNSVQPVHGMPVRRGRAVYDFVEICGCRSERCR
jgi:hypothetical protein